jgi:hypothetical protein
MRTEFTEQNIHTEQNNYELEGMKYEMVAESYKAFSSNSSGRIEGNQRGLYCCLQIEHETF